MEEGGGGRQEKEEKEEEEEKEEGEFRYKEPHLGSSSSPHWQHLQGGKKEESGRIRLCLSHLCPSVIS